MPTKVKDPPSTKPDAQGTTRTQGGATPDVAAGGGREPAREPHVPETPVGESETSQRQRDKETWRRWKGERGEPEDRPADETPAEIDDPPPRRTARDPDEDPEADPAPSTPARPAQRARSGEDDDEAERRTLEVIAESVLKRDGGYSPKAIKRILKDSDDEELTALVKHRRKVQSDQDAMGQELTKLKAGGGGKPETAKAEEAKPPAGEVPDAIKAMGAHFRTVGDSKGADLWDQAMDALSKRAAPPAEPSKASVEQIDEDRVLFELRGPIAEVAAKYPQLKGDAAQRRLCRVADRLMRERVFSEDEARDASVVLTRAAEVLFPTDPRAARAKTIDRNREQRDGQPSPETNSQGADGGGMTENEADRRIYRMLQGGKHTAEELAAWKRKVVRASS